MWLKEVSREELVDFVTQNVRMPVLAKEARAQDFLPSAQHIVAYWKDDPSVSSSIPDGLIVPAAEIQDFFAWVVTYVPLRPFTAYCRVLDSASMQYFLDAQPKSFLPFENCFLGIILGESARDLGEGPRQFSLRECAGTLSYCLTRATVVGVSSQAAAYVESQWKRATELLPEFGRSRETSSILRAFRIILALDKFGLTESSEDDIMLRCAQDIIDSDEIRPANWSRLTNWNSQLSRYQTSEIQMLPREQRIQLVRRIAEIASTENDPRTAFVIGYLASAVAPGSFDHHRTVLEFEPKFNGVLLWYGFCAGLYRKNNLQFFSDGLGRRLLRELERADSLWARPYCDVALSELELLSRASKALDFRLGTPGSIEIELGPCVTTVRPFARQPQQTRVFSQPPDQAGRGELEGLLGELDYKLQDLSRLRARIARALSRPEQTPLYPESRREPTRTRRR